jgi:hypothetical protein
VSVIGGGTHRVEFSVLLLFREELGEQFGVSGFGGVMEGAVRARWCGGYGVRSVSGYPGAPRDAIWESVGGEKMLGEIGFGGSRTHKTPATSSSSLSNMCARSRSAMLLTTSSVRVELLLGLDPLEPSLPFFRLPNAAVDNHNRAGPISANESRYQARTAGS